MTLAKSGLTRDFSTDGRRLWPTGPLTQGTLETANGKSYSRLKADKWGALQRRSRVLLTRLIDIESSAASRPPSTILPLQAVIIAAVWKSH